MDADKIVGNIDSRAPVKSVRIRVGRSIEGFGLSPGITKQQRLDVSSSHIFHKIPVCIFGGANYIPCRWRD